MSWLKSTSGTDGKSAYQIWLDNGNTGTITDFLNSLKGPAGSGTASSYFIATDEDGCTNPTNRVYKGWSVAEFYSFYDNLVSSHPKYIRKEVAPYKDYTNTYELRRYIFEPEWGYEKTIYIGAGVHGSEYASKCTLARCIQIILEKWQTNPDLNYMRNNVRMVIIPIVNPWGHDNHTLVNANDSANTGHPGIGTNCNRNYDGYWFGPVTSGGSDHNGASPFSEAESKWVRDTILDYGAENFHYGFDCHDSATASVQGDFWINANTFHETSARLTRQIVWYLADRYIKDREPYIWHDKDTTTSGVFPVWAGRVMGIPASTIEASYEGVSTPYDAAFMTKTVETYMNAFIVNTLADHKTPVFKSNKQWFNLEWWKAIGEWIWNQGTSYEGARNLWENLLIKYPSNISKSTTNWTTSDGKTLNYYVLSPKRYTKTILVVGGRTEPNREYVNFTGSITRLAELLCIYGNKDEHLSYIKNNIRLIFIPYLEQTTTYLNSYGNFNSAGVPDTTKINIANIVNIMNDIGVIDGVIYARELNKTDIYAATTDDSFVLASQDTTDRVNVQSYVDYLNNEKKLVAELRKDATTEFANYVFNQKNINCVRIDTGIDHKFYEKKKYQFDDQFTDTAVAVDQFLKMNSEVAHRINNIVNIIRLMCK